MKQSEALDMITKIQLAHQAMESACKRIDELKEENKNLKEALAKQEQRSDSEHTGEPVAWTLDSLEQEIYANTRTFVSLNVMEWLLTRLNTTPPQGEARGLSQQQRTWVGLTNKEIIEMWPQTSTVGWDDIRLIESKLKEKNT